MKRVKVYPPCPECMDSEFKKGGNWIQKATKSIERRGTEGKCTGSNFGGPGCPPGSKQYNLAKTFRKLAAAHKKEFGGEADQNVGINEYGTSLLNNFRNSLTTNAVNAFTEDTLQGIMQDPTAFLQYGGDMDMGYGYNPENYNIDSYIGQKQSLENDFNTSMWNLMTGMEQVRNSPTEWKAKTKFNREHPNFEQYKKEYRQQEKDAIRVAKNQNPWIQPYPWQMMELGGVSLPKAQNGITVPSLVNYQAAPPGKKEQKVNEQRQREEKRRKVMLQNATQNYNPAVANAYWNANSQFSYPFTQQLINGDFITVPTYPTPYYSNEYYNPSETNIPITSSNTAALTSGSNYKTENYNQTGTTNLGTNKPNQTHTALTDEDIEGKSKEETATKKDVNETDAAKKVEASRQRGNVFDEEETQTTTTDSAPASTPAGSYGYNPYYNSFVVYPQMGMFGQRTGRMPIAFDMNNTTPVIETRRALLPGNRIKSIRFDHYSQPTGYEIPVKPSATPAKTWKTPEVTATDEERSFSENETPYWRADERMFEYGGGLPRFQYLGEVPELEQERRRKELTQFPASAWPLWMQKPKGTNSGKTNAENIQEWNNSIKDDNPWASTTLKKMNSITRHAIGPAIAAVTSIGRQRTAQPFNLEDMTAAEKVMRNRKIADTGWNPFNPVGVEGSPNRFTPVQFTGYNAKKGGRVRKFQQGGTYSLTDTEIQELLDSGAEIEFLD